MTLLLLAGTGEARSIAQALAQQAVPAVASLAGATKAPDVAGKVPAFGKAWLGIDHPIAGNRFGPVECDCSAPDRLAPGDRAGQWVC